MVREVPEEGDVLHHDGVDLPRPPHGRQAPRGCPLPPGLVRCQAAGHQASPGELFGVTGRCLLL